MRAMESKTRVTSDNLIKTIVFFMENGFCKVWENEYTLRMDRKNNNRVEVIYIPISNLNYVRYIKSEIHIINK